MSIGYEIAHCPVCNREDDEELAGPDDMTREVEELWEFHLRRLRPGTPERYLADRVVFSQRPPLRLGRCPGCGTLYRNPRQRARELEESYADEPLDEAVLRSLHETQRDAYRAQARRLTRAAQISGTGLEVGSYVGGFLATAREQGWDFEGVDVNESANSFARSLGFRVTTGSLESLEGASDMPCFRAVAIWNCFDQLPSPRTAVAAARALLSPGGILAIRVPNGAFYAALRPRLDGPFAGIARALLAHNNMLGFPYNHGFTPASLRMLLQDEGFDVLSMVGDSLVPISDRWTRRWAAWEERAFKAIIRAVAPVTGSPWFEIYARRSPGHLPASRGNSK